MQVTCPPDQYADTMRLARKRVNLWDLGIGELRPHRARTGALLLEVAGTDGSARVDALAQGLREALRDRERVTISRPIKTAELRIKDFIDSISVVEAVVNQGDCQVAEVRVGPYSSADQPTGNSMGQVPFNCNQ